MDTATEKIVLDNLSSWMQDKTLIAITHRNTSEISFKSHGYRSWIVSS